MVSKLLKCCAFLVSLSFTRGNIASQCSTGDSYWEVQQDKRNNTFTCTGLTAQDTIEWYTWKSSTDYFYLGNCKPVTAEPTQFVCDNSQGQPIFIASRTVADTGLMIINPAAGGDASLYQDSRLLCYATRSGTTVGKAGCRLDYINASEITSCTVQFRSDRWTVYGQCNIQKANSVQNRFRCEWIQTRESTREETLLANVSMSTTPSVGIYVNGSCNFTSYLPPDGQYTYHVTVVPGEVKVNASFIGSNAIRHPSSSLSHTCPQYVSEGGNLTCTCSVSDLGSPSGELKWNTSQSAQLYLPHVTASDSGTHTCQLMWNNTVTASVGYTLNVAYGPKNVTLTSNNILPLDTNGTQAISLTCTVSGSNPPAAITWIRSNNKSVECSNQLCVLTPKPPDDDGMKVECQAKNVVTNKTSSGSVTVPLNYPPVSQPEIIGNPNVNDAQPVYEGDKISLMCIVRGGKPANATVIKFTCPNKTDTPDSSLDTSSITSSLTFESVSSSNHGNCTCSAQWKNYDWYSKKASWALNVYTPPSKPTISAASDSSGNFSYPFMAGASGTLICRSNQTGRPEATYTWPVPATGHAVGSSLTFYNLSKEDNGRSVNCTASNSYTENRQPVENATFVLEVYYKPLVNLIGISNEHNCSTKFAPSNYFQCFVAEGKRVHINCTADSNPAPASVKWFGPGNDTYSNTSELVIMSTNHSMHDGDYNCTVITKQVNKDSRLPLASFAIFSIIVGYFPNVLNFSINNEYNIHVTVKENSSVNIKCLVKGRPTPSIRLINASDPEQSLNKSQPIYDVSLDTQVAEVSFSINQVPCEVSGIYRCEADNGLGQDSQNRTLLVYCAPRGNYYDGVPATINTVDGKGELSFRMIAHPAPEVKNMSFLGALNDSDSTSPVTENIMQAACFAIPWASAYVTCNISVYNITNKDEGFYKIVFANGVGETAFTFFVKAALKEKYNQPMNISAIIGGIVAALIVIIIITVAVVYLKRRAGKDKHQGARIKEQQKIKGYTDSDDDEIIINSVYARSGDIAVESSTSPQTPYEDVSLVPPSNQPHTALSLTSDEKLNNKTPSHQHSADTVGVKTSRGKGKIDMKTAKSNKNGKNRMKGEASMAASKSLTYENVAFETAETDPTFNSCNLNEQQKNDNSLQRNKDLIYASLAFDKSTKPPPPKREETEYVSIDLQKTLSLQHDEQQ